jgi:hypothetical protein
VPTEQTPDETVIEQKRWRFPRCSALPVARVRLEVNGQRLEKQVGEKMTVVPFDVTLKRGKANIRATLLDAGSQEISGAYFVYVRPG